MKYSFRITPLHQSVLDQNPMDSDPKPQSFDNPINSDYLTTFLKKPRISKFILSRESTPSLHYHGVVHTDYKSCGLRNLLKKITTYQGKGNGFFSLKKCPADDYAENYVCKDGDIVASKGYKDTEIKQYVIEGRSYIQKKTFHDLKLKVLIGKYLDNPTYMEEVRNSEFCKTPWVKSINGEVNFDSIFLPLVLFICKKYHKNPPARHVYRNFLNYYAFKYAPISFYSYYREHVDTGHNLMFIQSSEVNKIPFTKEFIYEELDDIVDFAEI